METCVLSDVFLLFGLKGTEKERSIHTTSHGKLQVLDSVLVVFITGLGRNIKEA